MSSLHESLQVLSQELNLFYAMPNRKRISHDMHKVYSICKMLLKMSLTRTVLVLCFYSYTKCILQPVNLLNTNGGGLASLEVLTQLLHYLLSCFLGCRAQQFHCEWESSGPCHKPVRQSIHNIHSDTMPAPV